MTPSSPAHVRFREKYLHGLDTLRSLGFTVIEGALTAQATHEGYRAGPPVARAAELQALFEVVLSNPEVVGDEGAPFGLDALLLEVIGTRRLPVVIDFDAGHTVPMLTLAEETRMAVDASGDLATVTVCEAMVTAAP